MLLISSFTFFTTVQKLNKRLHKVDIRLLSRRPKSERESLKTLDTRHLPDDPALKIKIVRANFVMLGICMLIFLQLKVRFLVSACTFLESSVLLLLLLCDHIFPAIKGSKCNFVIGQRGSSSPLVYSFPFSLSYLNYQALTAHIPRK